MIRNQQIDSFFERLAAAGVQHRCNWQAKRSPDLKGYDVEHLSFVGDGFAPSVATAILISYGKHGYGLYFDSETGSIEDDIARIAKPRAKETADARELAETLRLMNQHYGTLHDMVSDLIECGALADKDVADKLEECSEVADRAQRVLAARVAIEASASAAAKAALTRLADLPGFVRRNGNETLAAIVEEEFEKLRSALQPDFEKVGATLANVARYDAALNAAEIAPNGDDYNAIVGLLNGADYAAPRTEGR